MQISLPKFFLSLSAAACFLTSPYYKGSLRPGIDAQTARVQGLVHDFHVGLSGYVENWMLAAQVRQRIKNIEDDLGLKTAAANQAEPNARRVNANDLTP